MAPPMHRVAPPLPTAIVLSAYQLTEVTNSVTYFVLKINVVLKPTLMFKSFNK